MAKIIPPARTYHSVRAGDHYIRNYTDFTNHMNYIANNPQKHGLPEDLPAGRQGWPYVYTNPEYEDLIDEA